MPELLASVKHVAAAHKMQIAKYNISNYKDSSFVASQVLPHWTASSALSETLRLAFIWVFHVSGWWIVITQLNWLLSTNKYKIFYKGWSSSGFSTCLVSVSNMLLHLGFIDKPQKCFDCCWWRQEFVIQCTAVWCDQYLRTYLILRIQSLHSLVSYWCLAYFLMVSLSWIRFHS